MVGDSQIGNVLKQEDSKLLMAIFSSCEESVTEPPALCIDIGSILQEQLHNLAMAFI